MLGLYQPAKYVTLQSDNTPVKLMVLTQTGDLRVMAQPTAMPMASGVCRSQFAAELRTLAHCRLRRACNETISSQSSGQIGRGGAVLLRHVHTRPGGRRNRACQVSASASYEDTPVEAQLQRQHWALRIATGLAKLLVGLALLSAAAVALAPYWLSTRIGLRTALAIANRFIPGHVAVQQVLLDAPSLPPIHADTLNQYGSTVAPDFCASLRSQGSIRDSRGCRPSAE